MFMLIVNNNAAVANNRAAAYSDDVVNCPQLPPNCHYVQNCQSCNAPDFKCSSPSLPGCDYQCCSSQTVWQGDIKH